MQIRTDCGHEYAKPWHEGLVRYGVFFYCEVCGKAQALPVDPPPHPQYIETEDANEMYTREGWPLVPPTLDDAIKSRLKEEETEEAAP